jgi:hypothetical protein|tara:strand:- start:517 stop:711 length:195 start_codon:yes stop_codon:yes gene_type:complete
MRYALSLQNNTFLAACYEATGSGIMLTTNAEDACSYVTLEKALAVAQAVSQSVGQVPAVIEVGY